MFYVAKYIDGIYHSAVSGLGRNAGTLDHVAKSKRPAQRWAAKCRRDNAASVYASEHYTYKVEEV